MVSSAERHARCLDPVGDRFEPEATLTVGQMLGMVRLRGIHSFL